MKQTLAPKCTSAVSDTISNLEEGKEHEYGNWSVAYRTGKGLSLLAFHRWQMVQLLILDSFKTSKTVKRFCGADAQNTNISININQKAARPRELADLKWLKLIDPDDGWTPKFQSAIPLVPLMVPSLVAKVLNTFATTPINTQIL